MQAGLLITAERLLTTEMRPPLRTPCSTIERTVRSDRSRSALPMAAALAAATAQPQHCARRPLLTPSAGGIACVAGTAAAARCPGCYGTALLRVGVEQYASPNCSRTASHKAACPLALMISLTVSLGSVSNPTFLSNRCFFSLE